MATTTEEERAVDLARRATQAVKSGYLTDAARFLREANTIAPQHPDVQAGWVALKEEEENSPLSAICHEWVKSQDEYDGEKALRLVKGQTLSNKNAADAFDILYDFKGEDDLLDQVTGELLTNRGAQNALAKIIIESPTQTYYELFERGDDSITGLLKTLMNREPWPSYEAFTQGHRDCFMLSLAMMMEKALEHPERAMKGVANLLAAHAEHLKGIIDADSFDVILASLDIRQSSALRSHATLATVKLLESAPETAQKLISNFITHRVKRATADGLIVAFSAAAAIFPITVPIAASLFLTDGFVASLAAMVESKKSHKLEHAALELISAACVDKNCRDAINQHCRSWIEEIIETSSDRQSSNLSAVIMVKLGEEEEPSDGPQIVHPRQVNQDDLITRFKAMIIAPEPGLKRDSIEGLAFASLRPPVRETLANDSRFLRSLIQIMQNPTDSPQILFGGLTIFSNLTAYLPLQSEEEKRMAQLKAYANTQKPSEPDLLLDEVHVSARCKRVLDAGVVPLLVFLSKKASPGALASILQILLSLSRGKPHRGPLAQQGAVKLLISLFDSSTLDATSKPLAAQALSKILISTDPHHIFTSALPSTSAIRPLLSLLAQSETPAWQLHAFEALLALTNLASLNTTTQDSIVKSAFDTINDDLLLSQNTLLRRAAMELLCNLMASPSCIALFADPDDMRAPQRLHILLALSDVEDSPTRSAAGGALAMLLSYDEGVSAVLKQEKGIEFLLGLCRDEEEDIRYRGVVCLRSVVGADGDVGKKGVALLKSKGGIEALKAALKESRRQEVLGVGVETLKILLGQS